MYPFKILHIIKLKNQQKKKNPKKQNQNLCSYFMAHEF